jgi:hypothetical protein
MMPASWNSLRKSKLSLMKWSLLRRKNNRKTDLKKKARSQLRKSYCKESKLMSSNYHLLTQLCPKKRLNRNNQVNRSKIRPQLYQRDSKASQAECRAASHFPPTIRT